jgi:hypothetical protein
MKVKKIQVITEGRMPKEKKAASKPAKKSYKYFINNTQDQFPYIESAISIMDNNLKWWQKNWENVQSKIEELLPKAIDDAFEQAGNNTIKTHFTIYTGKDPRSAEVLHNGPAIEYIIKNVSNSVIKNLIKALTDDGILKGHKMFSSDNKLIVMF